MNQRETDRFWDIGRAECEELCALPGVLDDLSLNGCKIHFNVSVSVDMENDYELRIRPTSKKEDFVLIGHPQWVRDIGNSTEIGFKILKSPDSMKFESYVKEHFSSGVDENSSDLERNIDEMLNLL